MMMTLGEKLSRRPSTVIPGSKPLLLLLEMKPRGHTERLDSGIYKL